MPVAVFKNGQAPPLVIDGIDFDCGIIAEIRGKQFASIRRHIDAINLVHVLIVERNANSQYFTSPAMKQEGKTEEVLPAWRVLLTDSQIYAAWGGLIIYDAVKQSMRPLGWQEGQGSGL